MINQFLEHYIVGVPIASIKERHALLLPTLEIHNRGCIFRVKVIDSDAKME